MTRHKTWVVWGLVVVAGSAGAGTAWKQRAQQLEREARALAHPRGCGSVEECALEGLGHKACGGPREYLAYCTRTTDARALRARLEELEQAEKAWQAEEGVMSNCALTRRPRPRWVEGECRAR